VRKQVEALEDHPDLGPLACNRALGVLDQLPVPFAVADQVAVHLDAAGVDLLQVVDTAQERGLAGPRRADNADGLALTDLEIDAFQDMQPAEALVNVDGANDQTRRGFGRRRD
jgi:hypothetical protein